MLSLDRKPILYFEDPIGVTQGYRRLFGELSRGLAQECSLYRIFRKEDLLVYKGNRKSPGYDPDPRRIHAVTDSVRTLVGRFHPEVLVVTDPSLLFLCVMDRDADWQWATIDNLRGGVYRAFDRPLIVTYPLTAWYSQVSEKDIAAVNYGFVDEEQLEDSMREEGSVFYDPIQTKVSVGRFCLQQDWMKIHRILAKQEAQDENRT